MQAREVMTTNPSCCLPTTTARIAAIVLKQFQIGMLPVVDGHSSRKLIGVVTDRDLCVRGLASGFDPDDIPVQECMTKDPAYCNPDTDVRQVLALMATRRVRRIPVVDRENRVQGVVSIEDLITREAVEAKEICLALRTMTTQKAAARAALVAM